MMTVRKIRQSKQMTQMELAEFSGLKQATISDIERGKIRNPSWDTVHRLARALGVSPDELFPVPGEKVS